MGQWLAAGGAQALSPILTGGERTRLRRPGGTQDQEWGAYRGEAPLSLHALSQPRSPGFRAPRRVTEGERTSGCWGAVGPLGRWGPGQSAQRRRRQDRSAGNVKLGPRGMKTLGWGSWRWGARGSRKRVWGRDRDPSWGLGLELYPQDAATGPDRPYARLAPLAAGCRENLRAPHCPKPGTGTGAESPGRGRPLPAPPRMTGP